MYYIKPITSYCIHTVHLNLKKKRKPRSAFAMPLHVSRVPTILSLNQYDGDDEEQNNLLTPEFPVLDVSGSYLPSYNYASATVIGANKRIRSFGDLLSVPDVDQFIRPDLTGSDVSGSSDDDTNSSFGDVPKGQPYSPKTGLPRSVLDNILISEWDKRSAQGLFRYDVTTVGSKLLPGKWGFVSQCNEGRGSKKRATEYRVDQVVQEFDRAKFNFTKALQKEVLFAFDMGGPTHEGDKYELKPMKSSPSLVFINVSPIEYGHVLFVPRVLDFLPQQATSETVTACLCFVKASDNPYFRAGFNSLGAYGTINHLHFQAYFLQAPFPIERALTVPVTGGSKKRGRGKVQVSELVDYPVRALVFEAENCLEELGCFVGEACEKLAAVNQPHNLIICDKGARVFLIPQCFAERQAKGEIPEPIMATEVNPAAFEIAGHLPLKKRADFDAMDEEAAVDLLSIASLTEERFAEVKKLVLEGN